MSIISIKRILFRINNFSTDLNYGREIISNWARDLSVKWSNTNVIKILDVGCGNGEDLSNIEKALPNVKIKLYGIDYQAIDACRTKERGVEIHLLDIERDRFPFDNNYFNLIIANQIFEHTKEIFWILYECSRVLKTNGHLIVSVPNMAALHNRILLLIGKQPTCTHVVGPHIRGFTLREFREFIETANVFRVVKFGASNLFPLPPVISRSILRIFPGLGITILFLCERQDSAGNILRTIARRKFDTNFKLEA
ncbi:MAG: class I SAM-dependent methyltransferase [Candidatus Hodarchaeota archaeon]